VNAAYLYGDSTQNSKAIFIAVSKVTLLLKFCHNLLMKFPENCFENVIETPTPA
jgi:hypothetical protein